MLRRHSGRCGPGSYINPRLHQLAESAGARRERERRNQEELARNGAAIRLTAIGRGELDDQTSGPAIRSFGQGHRGQGMIIALPISGALSPTRKSATGRTRPPILIRSSSWITTPAQSLRPGSGWRTFARRCRARKARNTPPAEETPRMGRRHRLTCRLASTTI